MSEFNLNPEKITKAVLTGMRQGVYINNPISILGVTLILDEYLDNTGIDIDPGYAPEGYEESIKMIARILDILNKAEK